MSNLHIFHKNTTRKALNFIPTYNLSELILAHWGRLRSFQGHIIPRKIWTSDFYNFEEFFWAQGSLSCRFRVENLELEIWSWKYRVDNFELEISSWKFGVENIELEISSWKFRVGNFELEISSLKFRVWNFEFGISSCEFRVAIF